MAKSRGNRLLWLVVFIVLAVFAGYEGGSLLIVDRPEKADAIVVLAGETEQRPARGLQLLSDGLATRMLLDAPAATQIYHRSQLELARQFLRSQPAADHLSVCAIVGLSTRDEARDVAGCLKAQVGPVHSVLIVTSDFHTRRALAIFRHEIPGVAFGAAAAYDPAQYGTKWWQHRQWAKTFFDECVRLVWWYGVDRWRK